MNSFSLGTEEQPIWHYCMVHNSSVARCRSSKAKSEEAGTTKVNLQWIPGLVLIYRIIIINANSYSQYLTSKQVLGLRIFLTQPGRSLNAGYSWHYCMVHNSSVARCRSSKAKSEEAGTTKVNLQWIPGLVLIYRIIIINANSYSQYLTSKQVLGLRIFLTQPGRSLNAGYSWPGVFLLGASGRTGRFFTQLLFHNPHSAAIWQIHLIWHRKKPKQKLKIDRFNK